MVGRKISAIRWMTGGEMEAIGWERPVVVIVLDDGTKLFASSGDEENDPGTLVRVDPQGESSHLYEYLLPPGQEGGE